MMTRDQFLEQVFPALTVLLDGFRRERAGGYQGWLAIVREAMPVALPATFQTALYECGLARQMELDEDYLARLTAQRYDARADGHTYQEWVADLEHMLRTETALF